MEASARFCDRIARRTGEDSLIAKNKNKQKMIIKSKKMPCEVTQTGIEPGGPAHNRFVGDRTTSGPRLRSNTPGS